jgi:hypothetical protein
MARGNDVIHGGCEMAYLGFKAVEASAAAGGARNPAAVAASIGRKKYGKAKFQKAAASGKKMGKKRRKAKPGAMAGMLQSKFMKKGY